MTTLEILKNTKSAWRDLSTKTTDEKTKILLSMADFLQKNCEKVLKNNEKDMANSRGIISDVMLDRLYLDESRIAAMADGIREIVKLPDSVGETISETIRPNGMKILKKRVPIGLVAIIYESRPNVTSDAAALAVKSGNVCVLRGGKEAFNTSNAMGRRCRPGSRRTPRRCSRTYRS